VKVSRSRFAAFAALNFVVMMGLWVVYTFSVKPSELLTGAAAAVLATIGMAVVKGQDFARFSPEVKWLLYFVPLPWTVLKDTAVVFRAAVKYALKRKSDGYLMAVKFDAGGEDPKSSARRALATTLTNIAPNSVLIGIDRKNNVALVHLLSPANVPEPLRQLGVPS
jgi:multisubunit Na+/H+ antiporter MnhE subunit